MTQFEAYPGQIKDDLIRDIRIGLNVAMGHFTEVESYQRRQNIVPIESLKKGNRFAEHGGVFELLEDPRPSFSHGPNGSFGVGPAGMQTRARR